MSTPDDGIPDRRHGFFDFFAKRRAPQSAPQSEELRNAIAFMREHQKRQDEKRKYKCDFPGCKSQNAYSHKGNLQQHKRIHTEKPWLCKKCDINFSRKQYLNAHRCSGQPRHRPHQNQAQAPNTHQAQPFCIRPTSMTLTSKIIDSPIRESAMPASSGAIPSMSESTTMASTAKQATRNEGKHAIKRTKTNPAPLLKVNTSSTPAKKNQAECTGNKVKATSMVRGAFPRRAITIAAPADNEYDESDNMDTSDSSNHSNASESTDTSQKYTTNDNCYGSRNRPKETSQKVGSSAYPAPKNKAKGTQKKEKETEETKKEDTQKKSKA